MPRPPYPLALVSTPQRPNPCTLTITVGSAHQQGALTNAQAEADDVPLEIDGVCCYNFVGK
jgi:hypothetical protein